MSAWIEIRYEAYGWCRNAVALLVSAWIEMSLWSWRGRFLARRTPCECVDWNRFGRPPQPRHRPSHSLWVRRLKYEIQEDLQGIVTCRTPCECVDWNTWSIYPFMSYVVVALLVSAWIEMTPNKWKWPWRSVALLVSAWIEMRGGWRVLRKATCRTPCECVDWNSSLFRIGIYSNSSHSLWVRGLK